MFNLHETLKNHKKSVLFGGNAFSVDCLLTPPGEESFSLKGFTTFTGITIQESGFGAFGDTFELTIDADDVLKYTNSIPTKAWSVSVTFPQMNNKTGTFRIENVAIDRLLGMYFLKCSASTSQGSGQRTNRNSTGGI